MLAIVDRVEEFQSLQEEWERAWSSDPNATVFVAWPYIELMVNNVLSNWFVLTFRPEPSAPRVGFLVVEKRMGPDSQSLLVGRGAADETSFLCQPEYENQMLQELAAAFTTWLSGQSIRLINILDPRLDRFVAHISDNRRYLVEETKMTPCPYVRLPRTWDDYLSTVISPKTRHILRSAMRKIRPLQQFHVAESNGEGDGLDHHIESMVNLYQARWCVSSAKDLDILRQTYRAFARRGMLSLVLFWDGQVPVAGGASFIDRPRRSLLRYTTCYNPAYARLSPGKALDGELIYWAIERGLHIFDFGAGGEDYKYFFGSTDRFTRTVRIRPHTMRSRLKPWLAKLKLPVEVSSDRHPVPVLHGHIATMGQPKLSDSRQQRT